MPGAQKGVLNPTWPQAKACFSSALVMGPSCPSVGHHVAESMDAPLGSSTVSYLPFPAWEHLRNIPDNANTAGYDASDCGMAAFMFTWCCVQQSAKDNVCMCASAAA